MPITITRLGLGQTGPNLGSENFVAVYCRRTGNYYLYGKARSADPFLNWPEVPIRGTEAAARAALTRAEEGGFYKSSYYPRG